MSCIRVLGPLGPLPQRPSGLGHAEGVVCVCEFLWDLQGEPARQHGPCWAVLTSGKCISHQYFKALVAGSLVLQSCLKVPCSPVGGLCA